MKKHVRKNSATVSTGLDPKLADGASGLLLGSIVLFLAPAAPWLALPGCLLPLLPSWWSALRSRPAPKVFAPDPIAPDFDGLADDLAEDLKAAPMLGTATEWLLCPVLDGQGNPAPYSLDFDSNKGRLIVLAYGRKTIRKTGDLIFRPALPLPIVIEQSPVHLQLCPCKRRHEVLLRQRPLPLTPSLFGIFIRLWIALLLVLHVLLDAPFQAFPRLLVLALLPFLLRPLLVRFKVLGRNG